MSDNTSPLAAITVQLERIAAEQGFTSVNIGLNTKQADASRYCANLHFDDGLDGSKCVIGHGASIGSAINAAYRQSLAKRPNSLELVSEAA